MAVFVRVNNGNLKSFLGEDVEYATWLFEKHRGEGDTLQLVTPEQYQALCEAKRYKEACTMAAKKMELGLTA